MTYMILDSTGSAINSYTDEVAAHVAMRVIVEDDPNAAGHLLLLAYDDEGNVVGNAVAVEDLPEATSSVNPGEWSLHPATRSLAAELSLNRYVPAASTSVVRREPAAA
jgi:hypothetical protein